MCVVGARMAAAVQQRPLECVVLARICLHVFISFLNCNGNAALCERCVCLHRLHIFVICMHTHIYARAYVCGLLQCSFVCLSVGVVSCSVAVSVCVCMCVC